MSELPQVIFLLEDASDKYGGPIRSVSRLQQYLHKAGISSRVSVARAFGSFHNGGENLLPNAMTTWQLFKSIVGLKLASKSAVLVFNNQWTVMVQVVGIICLLFGIPYIWWIRGVPVFDKLSLKGLVWMLSQKKLLVSADAIICSSKKGLNRIRNLVPNTRARFLDIPNILKFELNENLIALTATSEEGLKYDDRETVKLLSVGRFHSSKRLLELIDNCPTEVNGKAVELTLVGYSDDEEFLNVIYKKAKYLGLDLTLMPNASDDEIVVLHQNSDMFISLSKTENFGNSIGEALIAGLPVIITAYTDFWPDFDFEGIFVTEDNQLELSIQSALAFNCRVNNFSRKHAFQQHWTSYANSRFKSFEMLCVELLR